MDSCPKPNSDDSAWPWKFLNGESFGEGASVSLIFHYVQTFFWTAGDEVTRWYYRKLAFSLKLPSITWMWALILHNLRVLCIFFEEEPENCPQTTPLILDCSCIFSTFPPSLTSNCLNLLFGTQERMGGQMKTISYKQRNRKSSASKSSPLLVSFRPGESDSHRIAN